MFVSITYFYITTETYILIIAKLKPFCASMYVKTIMSTRALMFQSADLNSNLINEACQLLTFLVSAFCLFKFCLLSFLRLSIFASIGGHDVTPKICVFHAAKMFWQKWNKLMTKLMVLMRFKHQEIIFIYLEKDSCCYLTMNRNM